MTVTCGCERIGVQCSTSSLHFTVPFDEDERDPTVWFLDHDYLQNMFAMFRKVNGQSSCGE